MKEKKTVPEKIIVIDIKLTGRVVTVLSCALVAVGLVAYLMLTGESAAATGETSPTQSSGMRRFYLTHGGYYGDQVLTACIQGYHFASLWELTDPSNLEYYTRMGDTQVDSGQGPPSEHLGWVRTGFQSVSSGAPGRANCDGWTTSGLAASGTTAQLPWDWTGGLPPDIGAWWVSTYGCSAGLRVWCIED